MREVSLWLVHGTHVWQGVLGLASIVGVGASWLLIDRAMRARAARVREAMGAACGRISAEDAGKELVLTGRIVSSERTEEERAEEPAAGSPAVATVIPQGFELAEEATPEAVTGVIHGKRLELAVGDVRVTVDAPVQVIVGARETERCLGPDALRAMLWDFAVQLGKLPPKAAAVRTVAFGDVVRVRGVLRHEPDYGAADDYRSSRGTFSVVVPPPTVDADADAAAKYVPIAFEGSPRPLARRPFRMAARAAAFPLGALVLLGVVGEAAVRMGTPAAAAVAAVTPFRRADGLAQLRDQLRLVSRLDERLLTRAVELDLLRARCGDAADDLYEHGSVVVSAETAARCGDRFRTGRAYASLGDFERAAAEFQSGRSTSPEANPTLTEATAYLVAGKYAEAASAARALARSWDGVQGDRDRLECLAEAIDARAGSAKALEGLAARKVQHPSCTLLLADLLHGEERKALLYEHGFPSYPPTALTNYFLTAQLLEVEEGDVKGRAEGLGCHQGYYDEDLDCRHWNGQYLDLHDPPTLYADPRRNTFAVPAGLVKRSFDALGSDGRPVTLVARTRLTLQLVLLDSFLGRTELARERLTAMKAEARALVEAHSDVRAKRIAWRQHLDRLALLRNELDASNMDKYERALERETAAGEAIGYDPAADEQHRTITWVERTIEAFEAALAVRDFRRTEVDEKSTQYAELDIFGRGRTGDAAGVSVLAGRDQREANGRLWDLLRSGDGAGLAERLRSKGLDGRGVIENARAAGSGRDDLAAWLRWSYPPPCSTCGVYPLANRTASRLDAALALEQKGVEAEERAVAGRLHDVLYRRDIAIPLAILSELSPP